MAENCNHNCETCSANCGHREKESLLAAQHELSQVKKVIGVVSGKGGVGKSLVTSLLAVLSNRDGYRSGILDADITGPSIPRMFGLAGKRATGSDQGIFPVESKTGIPVMSVNLLTKEETDPVVWRGPVIAGTVKQFWSDVIWGEVDELYVDMPPGTGDVPLTVFQSLPVNGIVVVASPQELVSMIVQKAVRMAELMQIPVLGLVENMSYLKCPDCGKEMRLFGESHIDEVAKKYGLPVLGRIPIEPRLAAACDSGLIELFDGDWLDDAAKRIHAL